MHFSDTPPQKLFIFEQIYISIFFQLSNQVCGLKLCEVVWPSKPIIEPSLFVVFVGERPKELIVKDSSWQELDCVLTHIYWQPPPTTPAAEFKHLNHRFVIQNGRTRENGKDFLAFKQHFCLSWGSIITTLKYVEKFLRSYAVPLAFINGDKWVPTVVTSINSSVFAWKNDLLIWMYLVPTSNWVWSVCFLSLQ